MCVESCRAGEHRESGEDGADHQRVPHSQQQMGSDLLPVQREDRSVYTGRVAAHVSYTGALRDVKRKAERRGFLFFMKYYVLTPENHRYLTDDQYYQV